MKNDNQKKGKVGIVLVLLLAAAICAYRKARPSSNTIGSETVQPMPPAEPVARPSAVKRANTNDWLQRGGWVVARVDMFPAKTALYSEWVSNTDLIARMAEILTPVDNVLPAPPERVPGKLFVIHYFGPNSPQHAADWALMENSLTNAFVRNFYLCAHGNSNNIGDPPFDDQMESSEMESFLHQNLGTNAHSFRFVFMDACKTDGTNWPQSFGIPTIITDDLKYFKMKGIPPCAFVGWRDNVVGGTAIPSPSGILVGWSIDKRFIEFRSEFIKTWTGNFGQFTPMPLLASLNAAKSKSRIEESFTVRGYTGLMWDQ